MDREKLIAMVTGVQNGDDNAMTDMYNAFHNDIHYYISKTVNDPELASDLTQDTFIEILQSIGSLQEPAAFVTWSRQIAYRRCTAYFKKRHDILVDEDEDGYSIFDTIAEDRAEFIPDEALDKEDLKQTIHSIIDELPEEQRSAIMMRYFDEIPVSDIAKVQGVSEGTVKSRLNYGRKAIKQSVENYEKKHNVKLHCAGVIPLLLWLLREYRLANGLSLTTGAASASVAPAVAETATAATATTATTTAVATKTVGTALAAKIAAGIVAASVAIGGIVLATQGNNAPCQHQWQADGERSKCTLCKEICGHKDSLSSATEPQEEGVLSVTENCSLCGWTDTQFELTFTDNPIYVTRPTDWIAENLSEESYASMASVLKELQKDTAGDVECTPVGVLYYYNEDVQPGDSINNRLVVIFHVENGIVPGGWYTYISPNSDAVIKSVKEDGQYAYHSVVCAGEFDKQEHIENLLPIFYSKEVYSFWVDTPYQVHFDHGGVRYSGHTTIEDCLIALEQNLIKAQYAHLTVSKELKDYIPPF